MSKPWRTYEVTVEGYGVELFAGPNIGRVRYQAFQAVREATWRMTFEDFLHIVRVRVLPEPPAPPHDGYQPVRDQYEVDVRISQRLRLRNEGQSSGREGFAIYPGRSCASVIMVLDGERHPIRVHPYNVEAVE